MSSSWRVLLKEYEKLIKEMKTYAFQHKGDHLKIIPSNNRQWRILLLCFPS